MKKRNSIFKSINNDGITREMICIEVLQENLMDALKNKNTAHALEIHKDIEKSIKQIQQYEKQSTVQLLMAAAKITP
ncbi:hypothetical protein, partial [Bacillus pumilus]